MTRPFFPLMTYQTIPQMSLPPPVKLIEARGLYRHWSDP